MGPPGARSGPTAGAGSGGWWLLRTPWLCFICRSGSIRVWSGWALLGEDQFNQLAWYPRVTFTVSLAFNFRRSSGRCGAAQSGRLQVVKKIWHASVLQLQKLLKGLSRCGLALSGPALRWSAQEPRCQGTRTRTRTSALRVCPFDSGNHRGYDWLALVRVGHMFGSTVARPGMTRLEAKKSAGGTVAANWRRLFMIFFLA
jgi:hypothetical protein